MPQLAVTGEVVQVIADDLGLKVDDPDTLRAFWTENEIDTQLDWQNGETPAISINRQDDVAACEIGDRAEMTIETQDRTNGRRGIRTIEFRVLE